ncbi:hypothetical protein GCM10010256_57660 [Streptomyces coeruleorubidus]|uniref:Uncharacterized protein n=1 Tax=Streptomyces coeruleorubidus TaxID=116188 RepID=A0A5J6I755_STRC4|nr:hypothetical protein CP976_31470 [Streptomyces coeruleorubidus]GGT90178.1 hypothetical protein GCM10010256_57660 [Streptomyces coeruleorubidus]
MKGVPGEGAGGAGGVNGAPGAGDGAGGVKGAPGAGEGAGAGAEPEACPWPCLGMDDAPPEGLACGGGVSPGSGGTGPLGAPEPPCGRDPPGAPEALVSSDWPAPCPELELPEAFCVYQAGGA